MINLSFKKQLVLFLLLVFPFCTTAEEIGKLLPVDEGSRDLSFVEFRDQMLIAIDQREPELLVTLVDHNIWVSKRERGMARFLEIWQPEAIDTELWNELGTVLRMGGAFMRSERGVRFCAPYTYTTFPDALDPFGHGVVIKERSLLKSAASINSRTLNTLSYELVKVHDWRSVPDPAGEEFGHWVKVTSLISRTEGYIVKSDLRSPTDYSACFLYREGRGWLMDSFMNTE